MKKILILGGAGYIGSYVSEYLNKNFEVTVFDSFYFKNSKSFNKNIKIIKKDIFDVKVSDFKNISAVCDFCGIPNDPSSELNKKHTWKINYKARLKFAKTAKKAGIKTYIFNSTCSIYGHNDKLVKENSIKNPISTYAKANLKAEQSIYDLKNNNFHVYILRNATLFGFSKALRLDLVINIFALNIAKKQTLKIDGDGMQWRPFVSVKDVSRIYELILNKGKKSAIYNLVSFNFKVLEMAKKILKLYNLKINNLSYVGKNKDKRNYRVSNIKLLKDFPSFKFTDFNKDFKLLVSKLIKDKINKNIKTIRLKFYKKLFIK